MSSSPFSNSAASISYIDESEEVLDDGAVDLKLASGMTPTQPPLPSPSIGSTSSPSPPRTTSPLLQTTGDDVSLHRRLCSLYSSRLSLPPPSSSSSTTSTMSSGTLSNNTTGAVVDGVNDKTKKSVTGAEKESDHKPKVQIKGNKLSVQFPKNRSREARRYKVVLELPSLKRSDVCNQVSVKRVDPIDDENTDCVGYCSVCLVRPSNCVFLPCGHINTCIKCGSNLYLRKMKCPVCRKTMKLRPYQVYV